VLLSAHYRQTLNFTFDALKAARSSLHRLDEFRRRLMDTAGDTPATATPAWADASRAAFRAAMDDDLNTPEALSALYDMVHGGNRAADNGELDAEAAAAVIAVLDDLDCVLGVLQIEDSGPDAAIEELLAQRKAARAGKDWAESDRIRDALAGMGWEVRDGADGQVVRRLQEG
jgi:cysteinyl-tRNA synthetase